MPLIKPGGMDVADPQRLAKVDEISISIRPDHGLRWATVGGKLAFPHPAIDRVDEAHVEQQTGRQFLNGRKSAGGDESKLPPSGTARARRPVPIGGG